jgi:hypothetical protein
VAFELMTGVLELARFMRIELRFDTADFADQDMEVGRQFFVPDKSGERKFLDGHRILLGPSIARLAVVHRFIWGTPAPGWQFVGCSVRNDSCQGCMTMVLIPSCR